MTSLILHHFDASPFSEKVRLILGYKNLAWQSVQVPRIMPKPDLMPLTGGYRKTPVLQIGRDIYCDTRLIARTIDRLAREPTLLPPGQAASVRALEHLADSQLFLAAVPVLFRPEGRKVLQEKLGDAYLAKFQADRAKLFQGGSVARPDEVFSRANWAPAMADLDAQLAESAFLLGDAPTLADFAVYHPVWYVRGNAGVAPTLDVYPHLLQWFARMRDIGHGRPTELAACEALEIASDCQEWQSLADTFDNSLGLSAGDAIVVSARDYGVDGVAGELVHLDALSVVVAREVEGVGPVRVHFPRVGFDIAGCA
ncbi:glutathione S-transferase family protein [Salinisphaera aquimarina]|uniref:Glutathione S-transferase family protein n=1 Tax=Salinisphaera aquimarina TaxID=2094031 RepID=A0ABV7EPB1_9GAMM